MTDKKEKIIKIDKIRKEKEASALGDLLPQIFSKFNKDLKPKLITCFEALDDSLFDLAEKADSNQNQTLYFESMRLIRKSRDKIFLEFFNAIQATFKSFKQNNYAFFVAGVDKEDNDLSLSLIDEKELDETLAKINLITKSEMAFHRHIFALKKRFSVLASGTKLKSEQIPIGPYVIVNSFTQSIKILDIDVTMKLIIYKLFERNVMGQLSSIYTMINDFLAENGIVPVIQYNLGRGSNQGSNNNIGGSTVQASRFNQAPKNVSQVESQNIQTAHHIDNVAQHESQVFDPNYQLISQLFKQNNESNQSANATHDNNTPYQNQVQGGTPVANIDMNSMMNALSILQGDMFKNLQINESGNQQKSPTEIKDELIKQLHKIDTDSKEKVVKQKDEDTIDLVGMLFQFIVDDRNLPDAIQVILARLQIPYLKIALQDRNLFADKSHPARLLLDKMSLASVGWSVESDNKGKFIKKLEEICSHILEVDEYQVEEYVSLNADLDKFLNKIEKKAKVIQKRTKEKSLGQDKIFIAKQESAQLLVKLMTNKQMPILVRDILLGEWVNVLVLMYLRHSKESKEYRRKVKFVKTIIDYSQKKEGKEVTEKDIKDLCLVYELGLKFVAFNPKEIINKQHDLVKCLHEIHDIEKGLEHKVELISPEEVLNLSEVRNIDHEIVNYIEEIIDPSEIEEEIDHEDIEEYLKNVSSMKIATWYEFIRKDETAVRAKLSWISPITGKYLFVNSRGLKITDKTPLELAIGFKNETVRNLKQVAIFDRALSAIANKLKKEDKSSIKESETLPQ